MSYRRIVSKYRFLISDTLPFELPVIFSNRLLCKYLRSIKFTIQFLSDSDITFLWDNKRRNTSSVVKILCGIGDFQSPVNTLTFTKRKNNGSDKEYESIPLRYEINKTVGKQRVLSLVHPLNQLTMMGYFEKYKELICYYCGKSRYSLRYPKKVATWRYIKDFSHYLSVLNSDQKSTVEEFDSEYESQKSFFRYEKYSNVYKFYESKYYHSLEKKYNHLMRIDVSKCFESIYSHSISWAIFGKEYAKQNRTAKNFASYFDTLMQRCNRSETNGIVIGPEFSRVFSEMLLQQIDLDIEKAIEDSNDGEIHICRYVDDYFVFYNSESVSGKIEQIIKDKLSPYGLFLNDSKRVVIDSPIITSLSIGKHGISHLLDQFSISGKQIPKIEADDYITVVKKITKENVLKYTDIQNYLLSVLERRIATIVVDIKELVESKSIDMIVSSDINKLYYNLLKIVFFLVSVCPLYNSLLISTRIIVSIIDSINTVADSNLKGVEYIDRTRLFDFIFSEIKAFISSHSTDNKFQLENSFLLLIASKLGSKYSFSEAFLKKHICTVFDNYQNKSFFELSEFYFLLMVVRFYIKDNHSYCSIGNQLNDYSLHILQRDMKKTTSAQILLLVDSLACPYIDKSIKREFLKQCYINGTDNNLSLSDDECDEIIAEIVSNQVSFTNWKNFKLEEELDLKKSQFVY